MTLRANIWANYANQAYSTIIGLVTVPVYLRLMGSEAYGLIGFFTMIQAIFNFLDIGLTHTVSRDTARMRGSSISHKYYRCLINFVSGIFWVIAFVGGGALFALSETVATEWLRLKELSIENVKECVQLAAGIVALRWLSGLYRGIVSGSEDQVWLSWYASVIATLRYLAVIPVLMFVSNSPVTFFLFQFAIGAIELTGLAVRARKIIPAVSTGGKCSLAEIRPSLHFSAAIATSTTVWVLATQADKVILSKLLTLSEFGHYSIAVLLASVIGIIGSPISNAVLPRMVKLIAEGRQKDAVLIYRTSIQTVAVLVGAVVTIITMNAEPLLQLWMSDHDAAKYVAPILSVYLVGSGLLALSAYPYYMQYAKGDLRLHIISQFVFAACFIPLVSWAAINYGGIGAAWSWFGINFLYFMVFPILVHRRVLKELGGWFYVDIASIIGVEVVVAYVGIALLDVPHDRNFLWIVQILVVGLCTVVAGGISMWACRVNTQETT